MSNIQQFPHVFSYRQDGQTYDLHNEVNEGTIELIVNDISVIRHTAAHVLAHAIQRLYQNVLFGIGPVTESGFFYDILSENNISEVKKNIPNILKEMNKIIDEDILLIKSYVPKEHFILNNKDVIKKYIAENLIEEDLVSIYTQKDFYDLCQGPHLLRTGLLHGKLISFTEVNQVTWHEFTMIRLSFDLFNSENDRAQYYEQFGEMCERDHRILFKNMEICSFPEECSGMVLWQPNGLKVVNNLKNLILKVFGDDYKHVVTPPLCKNTLWEKTGHLAKYADMMFVVGEEAFKPMNCPEHTLFFKSYIRSYRDLPFRVFEFGEVFRNEAAGGLVGCKRLRNFTQDDGHIFCTLDQCKDEIVKFMKGALYLYRYTGFTEIKIVIATRPTKSFGTDEEWVKAIQILKIAMDEMELKYEVDVGGGAFYGPKIEIHVKDNKGKFWQCGTIQVDFFLAHNLGATYINSQDDKDFPIVLHRAAVGSLQRFLAITAEHNNGLPLVLHFCQVRILPVSMENEEMMNTCIMIHKKLMAAGVLCDICGVESISKRIKIANKYKIPYVVVVGDDEVKSGSISVRFNNENKLMNLDDFMELLQHS